MPIPPRRSKSALGKQNRVNARSRSLQFDVLEERTVLSTTMYANRVLDFFDSGAGPIPGPYGGSSPSPNNFPVPVSTDVVLGPEPPGVQTFLSLPTGSSVTVGFERPFTDGPGNDITVPEAEPVGERADVYVRSENSGFVLLGEVVSGVSESLDLASIGFREPVVAVRIVGRDLGGTSPGYDVVGVEVSAGREEFTVNLTAFIPGVGGNYIVPPGFHPQSFCDFGSYLRQDQTHHIVFSGDDRGFDPFATSFREATGHGHPRRVH